MTERTSAADVLARVLGEIDEDARAETAEAFVALAAQYIQRAASGDGAVSPARTRAELAHRFDEQVPTGGMSQDDLLQRLRGDIIADANRLMHPMYMGHQVSPPLPVAIWAECVIAALNQSVAVAEMSPTATAVEHRVVRWLCDAAGLGPAAGGTLTSGGTEATFTALLAARAAALPEVWEDGVTGDLPVVLCGEHTHYSVKRAAAQLGLGMRRAIAVASADGRMSPAALGAELERCHAEGVQVMAVVATAGSTATGAFDDLDAIGRMCEERRIWMHVDGAHGAIALLSDLHRRRLAGIERATSIAWDPHKMMLMPLPAGLLLVRDERLLERAFAQSAPYLFHGGEDGRVWDQGVRSFMCSRRADAIKVWLALQRHGADGLGALYDSLVATTRALWEEIGVREDFEALHEPETNILCFRWVGGGTAGDDRTDQILDEHNRVLRERYNRSGHGWITTNVFDGRRWLRVTIMNPRTRREHVRALLVGLAREARGLVAAG
jgi:L-2,4-diaminobutyrate decarboxylase